MRSRWVILLFATFCATHLPPVPVTPPGPLVAASPAPPPTASKPIDVMPPAYRNFVVKPIQQEISIEQILQGSLDCSPNQSTPCKKAEYQFTDGRRLVVTKKPNTPGNQLVVYETNGQIDRRFHPNKQRAAAGIPLR